MFIERWRGIRARIIAVTEAGKALVISQGANQNTTADTACRDFLVKELTNIAKEIIELKQAGHSIPPAAASILSGFEDKNSGSLGTEIYNYKLANLTTHMIKVDAALDDGSIRLAGLVERSILHLNTLISADESVRATWQRTLADGEVACEILGRAHFMLHGLLGIKAKLAKGETDQILAPQSLRPERDALDGMVLTEWKKVADRSDLRAKQDYGLEQAKLYAGPLSRFVLSNQRYIIVVSDDQMPHRTPEQIDGCTYHFRNIVVNPESVSKTAEGLAREGRRSDAQEGE